MAILGQEQSCWSGAVLAKTRLPVKVITAARTAVTKVSLTSASSLGNLSSAAAILTFAANNDDLPGSASLPSLKASGTHTAPGSFSTPSSGQNTYMG